MTELRQSKSPDIDEIVYVHLLKIDSLFRSGAVSVRFFFYCVLQLEACMITRKTKFFGRMCIINIRPENRS